MSQSKRKRDRPAPHDVPHSIPLGLETEKEMQIERKEMGTQKISELEVSASVQHNGGDDVDKKTSVKKKKGQPQLKKGELETHSYRIKNECSGKSQIEMSDLVHENKSPGLVSKGGKSRGQGHGSVSTGRRKKSAVNPKVWTSEEETLLLSEILGIVRSDNGLPVKKSSDIDWDHVLKKVSKKLGDDLTRSQVYEKARRLKSRYLTSEQKLNAGGSFKNVSDEEIYTLCQQIWGEVKTLRLHLEEDDEDPDLATNNKLKNEPGHDARSQHADFQQLEDAETVQITMEKENLGDASKCYPSESGVPSSKVHEEKVSMINVCQNQKDKPVEDTGREVTSHTMCWDAQKMLETFHLEHQAFVKEVEDSCQLVLQEMQVKLVTVVNNVVKEAANQFPSSWIGGMNLPSFMFRQPSTLGSHEDIVGNFIAANRLDCTKPAFENLQKRWQQQRLEELKLTSERLRLLLEECQRQQERLERETRKA